MKQEFIDKLHQEYPILFSTKTVPSCRDGWFPLIESICDILMIHLNFSFPNEIIHQVHITQIKEKFGGLRFYLNHEDDYMNGVITMGENYSDRVCEVCGSLGSKHTIGGWIQTLCDGDRERLMAEHNTRMLALAQDIAEKKAKK